MTYSQSRNFQKSILSRNHTLPRVKIIQNQYLQDQHILLNWNLLEISPFTTTPSQSRNFWKSILTRPSQLSKIEIAHNQSLLGQHTHSKSSVSWETWTVNVKSRTFLSFKKNCLFKTIFSVKLSYQLNEMCPGRFPCVTNEQPFQMPSSE